MQQIVSWNMKVETGGNIDFRRRASLPVFARSAFATLISLQE